MASAIRFVLSAAAVFGGCNADVLKVGGLVQSAYHSSFEWFQTWAASAANSNTYTVDITSLTGTFVAPFASEGDHATTIATMTTPGHANVVDVLICPYGSGDAQKCVQSINQTFTGPVFAWGAASDSIFDTTCAGLPNHNCLGLFSKGSTYFTSGLEKIAAQLGGSQTVVTISNNNAFSKSVVAGAESTVAGTAGLTLAASTVQLDQPKTSSLAILNDADKTAIRNAMNVAPDIVVIGGHVNSVEPIIIEIANGDYYPKAILATNGLTDLTKYGTGGNAKYSKCIMMPTQFDAASANSDPVTSMTTADVTTALGAVPTYQQAAAVAVGVAIANALSSNPIDQLLISLKAMDVDSFYGKLKWNTITGAIEKPMYTVQWTGNAVVLVAPTGLVVNQPLSEEMCWGSLVLEDNTTVAEPLASGAFLVGMSVAVSIAIILVHGP